MKKIFIAALLAIISVSTWGQNKLSPYTRYYVKNFKKEKSDNNLLNRQATFKCKSNSLGQLAIPAFVHINEGYSPDMLTSYGVDVRTVIGQIITADIPLETLDEVAALEGVKYIEMGSPIMSKLDEARKDTHVDEVHAGLSLSEEYRGAGVVVGVIDNGFDYGHPNFYTRDKSELRIKRVWDQNATGTPPEGFSYGCEYATPDAILAKGYDTSSTSHGTHVLGIAAGADNTDDKGMYGVATDAEIVLVSYNSTDMTEGDNTAVIDGIKYIFDYAESVGKPCVVNLSLGSWLGPRDGSSTFDLVTDELQGPGRLIVGSVGNDGDKKFHASKTFEGEEPDTLATFFDFTYNAEQYGTIDIWCDPGMDITFVPFIYNTTENRVQKTYEPARFNETQCDGKNYGFDVNTDGVWGTILVEGEINPLNGKTHLMLSPDFYSISEGLEKGFYIISSDPGTVHMWTEGLTSSFSDLGRDGFVDGNDQSTMGEIGGTGKRIISVGAYVTRDHCLQYGIPSYTGETINAIASFSSSGPTPDGRVKPEITAPGSYIISSLSSYYSSSTIKYSTVTWNGRDYSFGYMQGTSMASPFITGVIATWLQACPTLQPEQAREIMQKTARQDNFTGTIDYASNTWGYGKIDAYEGIKECIKSASEPNLSENPHLVITNGNHVEILLGYADSHISLQLYNMQGMCVASRAIADANAGEELTLDLDGTSSGIYLLRISGDNTKSMVKKIIVQ